MPVAAPRRPESISVDHHDPYLVNYRMAAIPVRIGNNRWGQVDQTSSCRLMGMARPGAATGQPDSDVVSALKTGSFGLCSLNYQLAGEKGDVALAFSSKLHGDPETPVFEAYQGERLLFRMIQGAQEVQHSFQIAGQPFRRNIDQAFPAGALPLDHAFDGGIPTRADCLARVSKGRPGEYTKWSDEGPEAFADPVARAHWESHQAALAECDNVEGFTFAQEIGISEHFEMKGSLRADQSASVEKAAAELDLGSDPVDQRFAGSDAKTGARVEADATGSFPTGTDLVPATSSDYLYSFGTVDAIWNGAWGLVRIYKDPVSADPSTYNLADCKTLRASSRSVIGLAPRSCGARPRLRQGLPKIILLAS
jgi:manganese oxidase